MTQQTMTLRPGIAGKLMVFDILPVVLAANDTLHEQFGENPTWSFIKENPQKYVRDFRTIRLSMGRRMGHTSAIGLLAKPGDLVVEITTESALYTCSMTVPGVECISRYSLMEKGKKFYRPYPTIWLADFNLWPRTSMNEVRDRLIKNVDQRMIILG
jgi:hypothetical protein